MYHYQKFEIPASWEWTTLGEIIKLYSGQDFVPEKYNDEKNGIPYIIGASNIQDGNIIVTRWTEYPSVISEYGDLLIVCKGAGVGKMVINNVGKCHIARQIQAIRVYGNTILLDYIQLVLQKGISYVVSQANGLIPGLPRDLLLNFPIPLPPIQEQKRISKTFLNFDATLKCIEQFGSTLSTSIKTIKSKILELAMQGKLVPQDPADEPAADLLRRVNPKARIITDNPHSWNIPNSWCWCQLGDIFEHNTGKALNAANQEGLEMEYLTTSNVYWNRFELDNLKKMPFKDSEIDKCQIVKGDLLVCEGGDVGRAAIWDKDYSLMIQNHLHRLRPMDKNMISVPLYCFLFKFYKNKGLIGGKGIALQGFSSNALHKLIIPLIPVSEQKRIIIRINKLFAILDEIEASLQS